MLNFSQASENNKTPILNCLHELFAQVKEVFEIGSGSGQHAIYFSRLYPNLVWQASELEDAIKALEKNIEQFAGVNVLKPVLLNVNHHDWPVRRAQLIYTANTLHIMSIESVKLMFKGVGRTLDTNGYLCIYGPFKYENDYTTHSNAGFDQWLKNRDPESGIRDFEAIDEMAKTQGLSLLNDFSMPANNQLLVFQRR